MGRSDAKGRCHSTCIKPRPPFSGKNVGGQRVLRTLRPRLRARARLQSFPWHADGHPGDAEHHPEQEAPPAVAAPSSFSSTCTRGPFGVVIFFLISPFTHHNYFTQNHIFSLQFKYFRKYFKVLVGLREAKHR